MVSFIRSLKAMVRSSNSVAVITFPSTVLSNSFCKRWQHLADTLLSIKAIPGKLGLLKFIFSNHFDHLHYCLLIACFTWLQMRTKTWQNCSQDIKIWLVFCMSTRWHKLIVRYRNIHNHNFCKKKKRKEKELCLHSFWCLLCWQSGPCDLRGIHTFSEATKEEVAGAGTVEPGSSWWVKRAFICCIK